ncbi:MAG: hypothetical protein EOM31_11470 [Bacteroidia bacterium]|nr:hypothetical protein [Bacteroidia bacterium]
MQYHIATIPMLEGDAELELLNKFLRSHKVLKIDKEFVKEGDNGYWTFCVSYLMQTPASSIADRREKKDYRLLLSEEHFCRTLSTL